MSPPATSSGNGCRRWRGGLCARGGGELPGGAGDDLLLAEAPGFAPAEAQAQVADRHETPEGPEAEPDNKEQDWRLVVMTGTRGEGMQIEAATVQPLQQLKQQQTADDHFAERPAAQPDEEKSGGAAAANLLSLKAQT